jgi:hypothetical protein
VNGKCAECIGYCCVWFVCSTTAVFSQLSFPLSSVYFLYKTSVSGTNDVFELVAVLSWCAACSLVFFSAAGTRVKCRPVFKFCIFWFSIYIYVVELLFCSRAFE